MRQTESYSQFGEDLILKDIFRGVKKGRCADIGARGLRGSNTAYFWKLGWFCQFIDRNVNGLLKDFPGAEVVHLAVTPENVNEVLAPNLDLLSIDIDGDDYYVWEAVKQSPRAVVIEFNKNMIAGVQKRGERFGCSESKMVELAKSKGYQLFGKTVANLIFIHETRLQAAT